jgi:CoA binding protein
VNPKDGEIFGEHVYPSLEEIDAPVNFVDVFRPPTEAETIARQAIAIGADVLWFQPGTHTTQAIPARRRYGAEGSRRTLHECNARRTGARTRTFQDRLAVGACDRTMKVGRCRMELDSIRRAVTFETTYLLRCLDRSARVSRTERISNPRSNFRWMPIFRQPVYL